MKIKKQLSFLPNVPPVVEILEEDPGTPASLVPEEGVPELVLSKDQFQVLLHEITAGRKRDAFGAHMWEHAGFENYEGTATRYRNLEMLERALLDLQTAGKKRKYRVKIALL